METILASVQGVLSAVLTGVVALAGKYVISYLQAQTEKVDEQGRKMLFDTALQQADKLADTIVKNLENTTVKSLKERSEDGKLTAEDIKRVRRETEQMLKEFADEDLREALGFVAGNTEKYLKALIEAKVFELKKPAAGEEKNSVAAKEEEPAAKKSGDIDEEDVEAAIL